MPSPTYKNYRYPIAVISHAVWLYYHFSLSYRDIEILLFSRGITVTYETIRQWSNKFGALYANELKKRAMKKGDKWHIDEMCIKIQGKKYWLFRAVDQDGYELDVMVQPRRNTKAVRRFFKKILKSNPTTPRVIVTDKLKSYNKPIKDLFPNTDHRMSTVNYNYPSWPIIFTLSKLKIFRGI